MAAAWSTYLYWLPCRGSMLEGTLIQPYTNDGRSYEEYEKLDPAVKASMDACLRRMDGDISESGAVDVRAARLCDGACRGGLAHARARAAVAAEDQGGRGCPRLGTVVVALAVAATIGDADRGEDHPLLTMLPAAVEWSALLALAMIWAWQPEVRTRRRFLRVVVALWGTTAFGIFHQMLAYMIMVGFSERDWDEPPGTGYLTVAAVTISAILLVIMTLRIPRTAADGDSQPDYDSGSLTLT